MSNHQSRRQFLGQSGGVLAAVGVPKARHNTAETKASLEQTYLKKGLYALASPKLRRNRDAHYGAAVCAGVFFMEEQDLPETTRNAVINQLDLMITAKGSFFHPLPAEKPDPSRIDEVAAVLEPDIARLKSIGHNVIFGALALKALKKLPEMATPAVIDGLKTMLARFDFASPWTFLGWTRTQRYDARVTPEDEFPDYGSERVLVETALDAFINIPAVYKPTHQGEVGHLLTLTDAVVTLGRLGYGKLARAVHEPHKLYIKLLSRGFDPADFPHLKAKTPFRKDPLLPDYWNHQQERDWLGGHSFKYIDALYRLLPLVDPEKRRQCLQKMRLVW